MAETLTVFQLNERVRSLLGSAPGVKDIWVSGEISNLTKHSSGHYYFTLKDNQSEIRCSLFKGSRGRIPFEPNENMKVNAFGRVDIYVQRGQYQLIVETMRASGIGDLYVAFEKLKKKLEAEDLFEPSRKRKIPAFPRRVGIVTSPTGAAIHDILTVSKRRFPSDILLYPALVQGEGAAASIVNGIEILNKEDIDVMIVGRGGGSIEDLWAFNEEAVARAIASSKVPIISAVGHETDITIADMVADIRAPTPSAAAELLFPDKNAELRNIATISARMSRSLSSVAERMRNRFRIIDAKLSPKRASERIERTYSHLNELSSRAGASLRSRVERINRRFSVTEAKLSPRAAEGRVNQYIMRLDDLSISLDAAVIRMISNASKDLRTCSMRLEGLNPTSVLGRGYAIVKDADGKTMTSASQISLGPAEIMMRDGKVYTEVKEVVLNEK